MPHPIRKSLSACRHRHLKTGTVALAAALAAGALHAAPPQNLALGLREMVVAYNAARPSSSATLTHSQVSKVQAAFPLARTDESDRVMVDVYLDGRAPIADVVKAAEALGCTITARVDWYRHGALSMYLPLQKASKLGRLVGVDTVNLSLAPRHHVGKATSQGSTVLKAAAVNNSGFLGAGITVGALSDSFDTNKNKTAQPLTNATQDAANDDLPGVGSASNPTPVYVMEDYGSTRARAGTDEGRAMLQIVHDLVPQSNLAFATADVSEVGFAQNIVALATPTNQTVTIPALTITVPSSSTGTITVNGGGCQVICDDVGYFDEPMFSDGIVAQAVDIATNNYGVSYFSSAGNDGNSGYSGTYNPQPNNAANQALLASQGGISATVYATIPVAERNVIESFQSFATASNGDPILVQKVKVPTLNGSAYGGTLIFQWDDPSLVVVNGVKQVTTDFDILTFSINASTGAVAYVASRSGTAVNATSNQPVEIAASALTAGTQYEFVIVRTNRPVGTGVTANQATHLRWVLNSDASQIIADFTSPSSVNTYGHPCATTCNGTAAYVYDKGFNYLDSPYVPEVEVYSSNGASTIYFDAAGNRLASPVTRKQPVLATVDGVDTSFFGSDSDGNGLPNFFGTSAASPHGAACAALLLNAAAKNGIALKPADVRSYLINTTQGQSDQDPAVSNATAGPVKFNAFFRGTYTDPNSYTIAFNGAAGTQLTSLVFNLAPINGDFFTAAYPVTFGASTTPSGTAPTISSSAVGALAGTSTTTGATETLNFANFNPGATLAFGVATGTAAGSIIGGDDVAGATFTATVSGDPNSPYTGTLGNTFSRKWNYKSGYGLVDINAAVTALLAP